MDIKPKSVPVYRTREGRLPLAKRAVKTAVKFETVLKNHLADAEHAAKYLTALRLKLRIAAG